MEGRRRYEQIAVALLVTWLLAGCRPRRDGDVPAPTAPAIPIELQPGDLVYRLGNGFFSTHFRDFSTRERRYSHVGIVVQTTGPADPAWVAHAEASELTGIGFVKAESPAIFLTDAHRWAVYRLAADSARRAAVAAQALDFCRRRVPFDTDFDAADSTAVYCTELVARCVNAALGRPVIEPRTWRDGKAFIAIDDTYASDAVTLIYQSEPSFTHSTCH